MTEEEAGNQTIRGWDSIPRSIWLADDQIDNLIQIFVEMETHGEIEKISPLSHERFRYRKLSEKSTEEEEFFEILVINSNNTVYTPNGFTGFKQILETVIPQKSIAR